MFRFIGMIRGRSTLWQSPDFVRFWTADTLSMVGSQVSQLALPLIAAITLHASAFEVGALAAAGQAPLVLFGLFPGARVERRHKRPVLIAADWSRAVILLIIPLASLFARLSMPLLYTVALAAGTG